MIITDKAEIINRIKAIQMTKKRVIVAIDGRCAAGKTTLSNELATELNASLFHMDDFFLQPHMRSPERLGTPGENVDHERFLNEVLKPLSEGSDVILYRPFNCKTVTLEDGIEIKVKDISIIEGAYSLHPDLFPYYDLRFFMDISEEEQMARILKRNGSDGAEVFRNKWIPLEEAYFNTLQIRDKCDIAIKL
jgi:uridine kinase